MQQSKKLITETGNRETGNSEKVLKARIVEIFESSFDVDLDLYEDLAAFVWESEDIESQKTKYNLIIEELKKRKRFNNLQTPKLIEELEVLESFCPPGHGEFFEFLFISKLINVENIIIFQDQFMSWIDKHTMSTEPKPSLTILGIIKNYKLVNSQNVAALTPLLKKLMKKQGVYTVCNYLIKSKIVTNEQTLEDLATEDGEPISELDALKHTLHQVNAS